MVFKLWKRVLKRLPEYMLEYDLMPMDIHMFWMALFASSIGKVLLSKHMIEKPME